MNMVENVRSQENRVRYAGLDIIRGTTLLSMFAYHVMWDIVYIFGVKCFWYNTWIGYVWQQSICWCFILLSGFCWNFSRKKWKHGLLVFLAGGLVTLITILFMPEDRVVFGILTLLGSSMLLMIPLHRLLQKVKPLYGVIVSMLLFLLFRNVNQYNLGFELIKIVALPRILYQNDITAYFGFPSPDFFSSDYFSLIPWFFLYLTGYFLYGVCIKRKQFKILENNRIPALEWLGRHSLILYMLHQPLVYIVLMIVFNVALR